MSGGCQDEYPQEADDYSDGNEALDFDGKRETFGAQKAKAE